MHVPSSILMLVMWATQIGYLVESAVRVFTAKTSMVPDRKSAIYNFQLSSDVPTTLQWNQTAHMEQW